RRQRIIISQSEVGPVKWTAILLMGLCALIAIAIVHSDDRVTCAIAVALFGTGFGLSSLLIAAYSRPFTGEVSVKPELLQQVVPSETAASHTTPEWPLSLIDGLDERLDVCYWHSADVRHLRWVRLLRG